MEDVFKALADPTRRALLDALLAEDGQTLRALTDGHGMTRVAVAKHLGILEGAGLVVTRRSGREKHHHLNVVPIREIHDRWITRFTEAWAAGLVALRHELEQEAMGTEMEPGMERVFEIYIRTTPERLWSAITDPETRKRFQFGTTIESDWTEGSVYAINTPDGGFCLTDGTNLEVDPPHRLVQTFHAHWSEGAEAAGTSRVTWEIEQVADSCRLTVIHDQMPADAPEDLYGGWPMVLSGLKTWLETGEVLTTPGSLMYQPADG